MNRRLQSRRRDRQQAAVSVQQQSPKIGHTLIQRPERAFLSGPMLWISPECVVDHNRL